jgi:adenosylhomocysteine nucleosidase
MKDLILIALESEAPTMARWDNVFFTGVGKINAALTAARLIEKHNPQTVWNFVERDKGKCPEAIELFLPKDPITISLGVGYTCSTGDNFVTDPDLEYPAHVVDMEAFAIAKACSNRKVNFKCYKYVSDSADDSADTTWLENVAKGEEHYMKIYKAHTDG